MVAVSFARTLLLSAKKSDHLLHEIKMIARKLLLPCLQTLVISIDPPCTCAPAPVLYL